VGYLNRPAETAASYVADGFLRTGDIGAIDENGFVTISDRIKEMIKVWFAIKFKGYIRRC
jgi:long-subunit acyl-CoA synthetase (AMP-forming)